jgi:tetratricopeptide (TPR) repeat protein
MAGIGCTSDQDLKAFLVGELPERLAVLVARHLELCPDCEERARRWDNLPDTAVQALRRREQDPKRGSLTDTLASTGRPDTEAAPQPLLKTSSPEGYTLLDELGRGATGVVFRARQHCPERVVALKFFSAGVHAAEQRARFLAEANIIARLDHPNIVRVHAVGEYQGQPFLCLELLDGGHLGKKIDGRPQPPRQAAVLLEQMARAVQHAHDKGTIHRDLKPSNVLLAVDGAPKISDFGLARFGRPELTATGAILGTPAYMAPEQARGEGEKVGPAADIWALGAILYELLTGQPPFRGVQVLDTLQQVVEREPVPPTRLQPKVPRDLETICLKCLEKKPPRRYGTAAALAEDLRRFLAGRPIAARPVGTLERAAKWARRRPAAAVLLALAVLLVLGGVSGLLWYQQLRLEQVQQQAQRELRTNYLNREVTAALREVAQARHKLHAQLRDPRQAQGLLSDIDQWQALVQAGQTTLAKAQALARSEPALLGEDLTVRLQKLDQQLQADDRDYQLARKLDTIRLEAWTPVDGKLDRAKALARYPEAFAEAGYDLQKGAAAQLAARIGQSPIRYALVAALDLWAGLTGDEPLRRRLLALSRQADPDPWRDQVREALAGYDVQKLRQLARQVDVSVQSPHTVLALSLQLPKTDDQGAALLRRALDQHPGDFWLHFNLGTRVQDPRERVGCFRAALALRSRSSVAHYNLGTALVAQKDYAGAITHFQQALKLDPSYAAAHTNWGRALADQEDHAGAIRHYQQALQIDPRSAPAHNNWGTALYNQKDYAGAIRHFQQALKLNPNHARAHYNWGTALIAQQDYAGAITHFQQALKLAPNYAAAHTNWGLALAAKRDYADAITHYQQALKLAPNYAAAHNSWGLALAAQKDHAGAIRHYQQALQLNPRSAAAHNNWGRALAAQQDYAGAITHYQHALKLDPKHDAAHYNWGLALYNQKDYPGAIRHFQQAIQLKPNHAPAHYNWGRALAAQQDHDGAIRHFQEALKLAPNHASAHYNWGLALAAKRNYDGAIAHYRQALQRNPNHAEAHCNLGQALRGQGHFAEALKHLEKGHQIGSLRSDWRYPSAQWVKSCRQLLQKQQRADAVLQRRALPTGPAEQLELAVFCRQYKHYPAAARLYTAALADQPALADDLAKGYRYQAAWTAALAAAGQGHDADKLVAGDKAKLRQQALAWLRADLKLLTQTAVGLVPAGTTQAGTKKEDQPPASPPAKLTGQVRPTDLADLLRAGDRLQDCLDNPALAELRDNKALAQLPAEEQKAWQQLWSDVQTLHKQTRACFIETWRKGSLTGRQKEQPHEVPLQAGRTYILDLQSKQFHACLRLEDSQGKKLAEDNKKGRAAGQNARILFTAVQGGTHRVIATSFQQRGTGDYTLRIREFTGKKD